MKRLNLFKGLAALLLLLLTATSVHGQYLRTSYFMEGAHNRLQLNPALQPSRGFLNIPVVGSFNVATSSNSLGSQDIINCFDSDGDFYNSDKFLSRLKTDNRLNLSLNTDLISFGFFKGKNFWSFNVGARIDVDASIPKSMFDYLRQIDQDGFSWNNANFDIRNEQLKMNAFTEIGLGFSRDINKRLTVGVKLKALLGMANLNMQVNQLSIQARNMPDSWEIDPGNLPTDMSASIKADAYLEGSLKGFELTENQNHQSGNSYIDGVEFGSFGVGGYGVGIDLGATYQLAKRLNVSAAIIDLGFISWSKGASTLASANAETTFDMNNYQEFLQRTEGGEVLNFDLIGLRASDEKKARKTSLSPTLVLGAEYGLIENRFTVGALSTTRFGQMNTFSEVTLSANYRPNTMFGISASYSMIQSAGQSFGLAFKVGPLVLGTDYMYLGENSKSVNAFVGISIPLTKQKKTTL